MKLVLLAHVLGGSLWFGAHVYIEGLMAAASRTGDPETMMTVGLKVGKTNGRLLLLAGVVTGVSGVWLVLGSFYDFEMIFITIGFVVVLLGLALGAFLFKPKFEEVEVLVAEHGLTNPDAVKKMKSLNSIGHVMTLLVSIAMVAMVLKPGL